MKARNLIGSEKFKYQRQDRKIFKKFFLHNDLGFFKYLDKKLPFPKHLKQRTLNWLLSDEDQPEFNNFHDDLAQYLWEYYENKLPADLITSPDTTGMSDVEEETELDDYYDKVLNEITQRIWHEMDVKIRYPEYYTEDVKPIRRQKKYKKYIETKWPKFARQSGLNNILTSKEIAKLMNFVDSDANALNYPPLFDDEIILKKLFRAWNHGKYDDYIQDDEDLLRHLYGLYSNWLNDQEEFSG